MANRTRYDIPSRAVKPKLVDRFDYEAELARPLFPGKDPSLKLPLLMTSLQASSDREAVAAMLGRHVTGHNVRAWNYPLELRGSPRGGASAYDRAPLVLVHLKVRTYREALVILAIRHVPGFRPLVKAAAGRNDGLAKSGYRPDDLDAELEDLFEQIFLDELDATGKRLTREQIAKRVVRQGGGSWFGLDYRQVVSRFSQGVRRRARSSKRQRMIVEKFRALMNSWLR